MLDSIAEGQVCTINALPRELYTGERGLGYARPGRIRGSVSVPFPGLIDPDSGEVRPDAELRRRFEQVGALGRERVITYCGGGIAASSDAFVLHLLGHDNVAVYDGSLMEWCADPELPLEVS